MCVERNPRHGRNNEQGMNGEDLGRRSSFDPSRGLWIYHISLVRGVPCLTAVRQGATVPSTDIFGVVWRFKRAGRGLRKKEEAKTRRPFCCWNACRTYPQPQKKPGPSQNSGSWYVQRVHGCCCSRLSLAVAPLVLPEAWGSTRSSSPVKIFLWSLFFFVFSVYEANHYRCACVGGGGGGGRGCGYIFFLFGEKKNRSNFYSNKPVELTVDVREICLNPVLVVLVCVFAVLIFSSMGSNYRALPHIFLAGISLVFLFPSHFLHPPYNLIGRLLLRRPPSTGERHRRHQRRGFGSRIPRRDRVRGGYCQQGGGSSPLRYLGVRQTLR